MRKIKILTNGCFDLLHAGHKRLIRKCLELSCFGELCILVNSDRWIKETKGEGRPRWPEEKRIEAINDFICGWCSGHMEYPKIHIVLFDTEKELKEKIISFGPDILVKGHDYKDVSKILGYGYTSILVLPEPIDVQEKITTTDLIYDL